MIISKSDLAVGVAANVTAALVAFVAGLLLRKLIKRRRMRSHPIRKRRYGQRKFSEAMSSWIVDYYDTRGAESELYAVSGKGRISRLPFLSLPKWQYPELGPQLAPTFDEPLKKSTTPIKRSVLRSIGAFIPLVKEDGSPWNDPLITLLKMGEGSEGFHVGWSEYYQYLSSCGALELETRSASMRGSKTPIRDRHLSNVECAGRCSLGSQAVGVCASVVYYNEKRDPVILLQRRKENLATYPGAFAVVPMFGCQPLSSDPATGFSPEHDLFREFGEELFGVPELVHPTNHIRIDWFYDIPAIRHLEQLRSKGDLEIRTLGFGFDGLNGELDLAMICLFKSQEFFSHNRSGMRTNWEIRNVVEFELFSTEVDNIIHGGQCHPGSAFAIDLARRYLA